LTPSVADTWQIFAMSLGQFRHLDFSLFSHLRSRSEAEIFGPLFTPIGLGVRFVHIASFHTCCDRSEAV
jgi:hypothetical protein